MTTGRLYLFAILCLILAAVLLLTGPNTLLVNCLGTAVTLLALVAYLFGIYLNRVSRRGDEALDALRVRVALAARKDISAEFRVYHRGGLSDIENGELLVFYRTPEGWLLVPILADLTWYEIPAAGVGRAHMLEPDPKLGVLLELEFNTQDGRDFQIRLGSMLMEPAEQTVDNVDDLKRLIAMLRD